MAFVAFAALNFGAIRLLPGDETIVALIVGGLPMANVLAVGLLIGYRRRGSRPFLLGFEAIGATALALYIAVAIFFTMALEPVLISIDPGRPPTLARFLTRLCVAAALLGLPQLAFALVGGVVFRRFSITEGSDQAPR
jgi:hypothetical protein